MPNLQTIMSNFVVLIRLLVVLPVFGLVNCSKPNENKQATKEELSEETAPSQSYYSGGFVSKIDEEDPNKFHVDEGLPEPSKIYRQTELEMNKSTKAPPKPQVNIEAAND